MLGASYIRVGHLCLGPRGGVIVIDKAEAVLRRVPRDQQFHLQKVIDE